ncbi:MAG: glycosyltransferase family 2 protein [Alphaproteobacteria bacterium]|nr:glycosyltransferase family 2 protein [Alphaproteobacteria bacterium]
MKIMFLMGGAKIQKNKEEYPLYLTELDDKLILEKQIDYCRTLTPSEFIFCIKSEDIKSFRVDSVIKQLIPNAQIVSIDGQTKGAVCTALLGAEYIKNDEELVLMAIDDFIEDEGVGIINTLRQNKADAGIVSFSSVHPRYSFAKTDINNNVIEVAEKKPISKNALVSFYYFKKGSDFIDCAKDVIRKDNPVGGAFYISQTLNEMILRQKNVVLYKVPNDKFHPLKTEAQVAEYLYEAKEERESK